jgi:hypothetical protein
MAPGGPGDETDDEGDGEEEEDTPDAAQAAPVAGAPTTPAPPPQKRTRKRRAPLSGGTHFNATQAHEPPLPQYPDGVNPQDPLIQWPMILEKLKALGQNPEYVTIRIVRTGTGPYPSEPSQVANIEGSLVAGGETESPGQALVDYVTDWVHAGRKGPAKYAMTVFQKQGRGSFPQMVLRLEDPEEIQAQKRRHEQFIQAKRMAGAIRPVAGPPTAPQYPQQYGYPPPPPQAPPQQAQVPQPVDTLAEFARYEQFRQQLLANGQPAPPPVPAPLPLPPPPPPQVVVQQPRLTKEEEEMLEEAKFQRMAQRLGYQKLGVGALPPVPPTAAAQAAADPVEAIVGLLATFERIDGLRTKAKKVFGVVDSPEEPDEPAAPAETEKKIAYFKVPGIKPFGRDFQVSTSGATFVDQIKETLLGNPEFVGDMGLRMMKGAAEILDKSSFASLVAKLATREGAPAQVAAAAQTAGMIGMGAVNGAAPHAPTRPRGPLA